MGNTPSTEQPQRPQQSRRTPQKLSKPKVGNHASPTSILSSQSPPSANAARLSNPYIVGSHPAFSAETIDSPAAQALARSSENVELVGIDKDADVQNGQPSEYGIRRSSTVLGSPVAVRRKSSGLVQSNTFDNVNRSRSAVHRQEWASMTSLVAPDAPQSSQDAEPGSTTAQGKSPGSSPSIPSDAAESSRNSHQQQAMDALLGRSQSETSLYAPARRRSVAQTPGVATRAGQSQTSLVSRKSFRKSAEPSSDGRRTSTDPSSKRHLSMPSRPKMEEPERAETPPDVEFKQIGGVKFGSLRITNASPDPTPGSEPRSNPVSPGAQTLKATTSLLSPDDIQHPRPQSAAPVSPKLLNAGEGFVDGGASSNDCSPFSHQSDGVSPFTVVTELSAQTTPEGSNVDPIDGKALGIKDGKVARSDSGFGSSSSAENAKDHYHKPERSISSTLSIRSFFGPKKASKQSKKNTKNHAALTQVDDKRPGLKPSVPYQSPSTETPPTLPQTSLPAHVEGENATQEALPRRSSFLGSFKSHQPKEAKETKFPLSLHARGKSMPGMPSRNVSVENPPSSTAASAGGPTPKKLQKLVTDVRRQSMPSVSQKHQKEDDIPSMPTDAAEKLQAHNRMYDQHSRENVSQGASFGPRPAPLPRSSTHDLPNVPVRPAARRQPSDRPPRPKSTGPLPYGTVRPPSNMSSRPPPQRKSILRKPRQEDENGNDSDEGEPIPDYMMGYEVQAASIDSIRKSAGNSAFDAAFVPMAEDNVMGAAVRSQPHGPMQKASSGRPKYPRLRTRSSAPDFLETVSEPADPSDPGSVDCYAQKKPKTPPPISIRTRGSKKKKRRMPPSSSHGARHPPQHPLMPDRNRSPERRASAGPEQDLTQSLRSMPLPRPSSMRPQHIEGSRRGSEQGEPASRRNSARPFYPLSISPIDDDQTGRYPLHPSASTRDVKGEDSEQPPFRVLHSYNSPAYKGVPIWS